jgi:predicted solute-binding protein
MTDNRRDTFTLGHSPDPDDAFMFYAMAQDKTSTRRHPNVERTRAKR